MNVISEIREMGNREIKLTIIINDTLTYSNEPSSTTLILLNVYEEDLKV